MREFQKGKKLGMTEIRGFLLGVIWVLSGTVVLPREPDSVGAVWLM